MRAFLAMSFAVALIVGGLTASKAKEKMVRYDSGQIVPFSQCKADGLGYNNPSHRPNPLERVIQYCNARVIIPARGTTVTRGPVWYEQGSD